MAEAATCPGRATRLLATAVAATLVLGSCSSTDAPDEPGVADTTTAIESPATSPDGATSTARAVPWSLDLSLDIAGDRVEHEGTVLIEDADSAVGSLASETGSTLEVLARPDGAAVGIGVDGGDVVWVVPALASGTAELAAVDREVVEGAQEFTVTEVTPAAEAAGSSTRVEVWTTSDPARLDRIIVAVDVDDAPGLGPVRVRAELRPLGVDEVHDIEVTPPVTAMPMAAFLNRLIPIDGQVVGSVGEIFGGIAGPLSSRASAGFCDSEGARGAAANIGGGLVGVAVGALPFIVGGLATLGAFGSGFTAVAIAAGAAALGASGLAVFGFAVAGAVLGALAGWAISEAIEAGCGPADACPVGAGGGSGGGSGGGGGGTDRPGLSATRSVPAGAGPPPVDAGPSDGGQSIGGAGRAKYFQSGGSGSCGGEASGDPHLRSTDGVRFDFQAAGEFVLVDSVPLSVQSRFEGVVAGATAAQATVVRVGEHVVQSSRAVGLDADGRLSMVLDGASVALDAAGIALDDGSFVGQDPFAPRALVAVAPDGSYVRVENNLSQDLQVDFRRDTVARGILGSPDGDPANDFTSRSGDVVSLEDARTIDGLHRRFGESWRVLESERLFVDGAWSDYQTPDYLALPGEVSSLARFGGAADGAVRRCVAAGVPAGPPAEGCAFDFLATGDPAWIDSAARSTVVSGADAAATQAVVPATANLYAAGRPVADVGDGSGTAPVPFDVVAGTPVRFPLVSGSTHCCDGDPDVPPDGAPGGVAIAPSGAVSGYVDDRQLALVGVFFGPEGSTGAASDALDFTGDHDFDRVEPQLGQVFFIGDGRDDGGELQAFVAPAGAARVYLGFADAFAFEGEPGTYNDNRGRLDVRIIVGSFATDVVSYAPGPGLGVDVSDPGRILGPPDCEARRDTECFVSLGSGGAVVVRVAGGLIGSGDAAPDIRIVEIGQAREDVLVEVSIDGESYVSVGRVTRSSSAIDIDEFGLGPDTVVAFVRLTDDPDQGDGSGATAGADIDAVVALSG